MSFLLPPATSYEAFKRSRRNRSRNKQPAPPLQVIDRREQDCPLSEARIRISRAIGPRSQADFGAVAAALRVPDERKILRRKSIGSFALTVFDTRQQPLVNCPDYTMSELEELFNEGYKALARPTRNIGVTGLDTFGNLNSDSSDVFIALRFAPQDRVVFEEPAKIQTLLSEAGGRADNKLYVPHVSIAKVFGRARTNGCMDVMQDPVIRPIISSLAQIVPQYVQFEPAIVELSDRPQPTF